MRLDPRVAVLAIAALAIAALAPSVASAQSLGLGRRLGRPLLEAPDRPAPSAADRDAEDAAPADAERPWVGPQIQLSYGHWKLADGYGGGDTNAASVGLFIQWPLSELRTGLHAELGSRDYSLGGDDLVVRGAAEIGFQLTELLDPLVPHISVIVSFGGLVGQRFDTTVVYGLGGAGVELGAALRVVRNLHVSASFGYHRFEMDGAAFDVFMFRLGLGL